ncbi:MAG: hypothetical protein H5U02_13560 [Clostridia bacterium]|nr:hypothetical protein [Clostridia bacterium]
MDELIHGPDSISSAAVCLVRSLADLYDLLGLPHTLLDSDLGSSQAQWKWLARDVESLEVALCRRLLLLPQVSLTDDLRPAAEDLNDVAGALCDSYAEKWTAVHALDGRLQR